jgi:glutaredoxin
MNGSPSPALVAARHLLDRREIDEHVFLKLRQADRIYQDHYAKQTLRAPTRVPLQPLREIGTGTSFGLVKGFQTVFKDGNSPAPPAPSQVLVYSATTMHSSYGEQEEWRIRHLFDAKNIMYEIVYVDLNNTFKAQMLEVSGSSKLPQVHIDRKHYTFEELQGMEDRQELDITLKHAHRRAGEEVGKKYDYEERYKVSCLKQIMTLC